MILTYDCSSALAEQASKKPYRYVPQNSIVVPNIKDTHLEVWDVVRLQIKYYL
jgi:hypothetical protein